jgi:hypothetical protein
MAFIWIGLSRDCRADEVSRLLSAWFPAAANLTRDEALDRPTPWPPIVFTLRRSPEASDFPSLVDFDAFPGDDDKAVAIGLALARRFSDALNCRAVSDGSGLGDDSSPYWSVVWDDGRAYLADDAGAALADGEGGALRIIRELTLSVGTLDDGARLVRG